MGSDAHPYSTQIGRASQAPLSKSASSQKTDSQSSPSPNARTLEAHRRLLQRKIKQLDIYIASSERSCSTMKMERRKYQSLLDHKETPL